MLNNLKDRLALVGGGLGLIGTAICKELRKYGVIVRPLDTMEQPQGNDLEEDALLDCCAKMGPDIFINASYPKDLDKHLRVFEKATRFFAENMRDGGTIINFASIYGFIAPRYRIYEGTGMDMPVWYGTAKAGVIQMSKIMAVKYASRGIRINCISPGGIFDNQPKEFVDNYCKLNPMGRMGTPEDIVGAVLFLASDASRYITGVNISIDGGFSL
jgi:NAD(P)-dependent dehydrogenase (short-subunit alcohol dehydrogenase family)